MIRAQMLAAIVGLSLPGMVLTACAPAPSVAEEGFTLTLTVTVPEGSGDVYLAGNQPGLGPWRADGLLLEGTGTTRTATLRLAPGTALEYKFTRGSWDREGLGPSGTVMPNFTWTATADEAVAVAVVDWKKDTSVYLDDWRGSGVLGSLTVWRDMAGPGLSETRHVYVWTPPGYETNTSQRYRVLYMHDGQNLFDPRLANTGTDWGVDEALVSLMEAGTIPPTMVVGVFSTSERRLEYAPQRVIEALPEAVRAEVLTEFGGALKGEAYLDFLTTVLKSRVDAEFRTLPDRANTFVAGSSMGALISLYALAERRDVFGGAACFSMHWPVAITRERIFDGASTWQPLITGVYRDWLSASGPDPATSRLWVDRGSLNLDALYEPYQDALIPVLAERGFVEGESLSARAFEGTDHNEAAWRARAPEVLGWLLRN
jgi:predicted alpha/beta superfamily hydrolase